jgi:hypothetical protein
MYSHMGNLITLRTPDPFFSLLLEFPHVFILFCAAGPVLGFTRFVSAGFDAGIAQRTAKSKTQSLGQSGGQLGGDCSGS